MTNTKFIDARFFEGDATALEDRLREFLQTFRKRKMARALMVADDCKPELDHLEIDDFGDDLLRGVNISVAENRMIRRRAALVFQRRMAASGLAHLKADEVKRLSVLKDGASLTPPGTEAWADELAATLHGQMPWMAPATETAWHALRRSAQRGDPGLRLPPMLLNGPAGIGKSVWARKLASGRRKADQALRFELDAAGLTGAAVDVKDYEITALGPWLCRVAQEKEQCGLALVPLRVEIVILRSGPIAASLQLTSACRNGALGQIFDRMVKWAHPLCRCHQRGKSWLLRVRTCESTVSVFGMRWRKSR